MRRLILLLIFVLFSGPVLSEENSGRSLIEQGAELFLEGLLKEMEPALEDMQDLGKRLTPALRNFMAEMGPALTELLSKVEDWNRYHPPEILENGDIIIRRKIAPPNADEIEI